MKNSKVYLLVLLAIGALFASCERNSNVQNDPEEDIVADFVNYSVDISVLDAETKANLLDPETEGNILNQEITMDYDGKIYPMVVGTEKTQKHLPAEFRGLVWELNREGAYILTAGEFQTGETVNVPFAINWGDGSRTDFVVTADVKRKGNKFDIIRSLTVDGQSVDHKEGYDWKVTIYK